MEQGLLSYFQLAIAIKLSLPSVLEAQCMSFPCVQSWTLDGLSHSFYCIFMQEIS